VIASATAVSDTEYIELPTSCLMSLIRDSTGLISTPQHPNLRAGGRLVASARMRISRSLLDEIVAHAVEDAPNECCGMIASRDGHAVKVYRAENAAASPLRYEIDGAEQYRIQMAIDDADLELGAIYHSHTRSEPYPSQTDINLAFYPDAIYVIVGVASDEPEVRAFTIRDGRVAEAELVVE
jgi:proteasome lid subunit RPN8/RPN11